MQIQTALAHSCLGLEEVDNGVHEVSEKLKEGEFKGAIRKTCSEDSLADIGVMHATFAALKRSTLASPLNSSVTENK